MGKLVWQRMVVPMMKGTPDDKAVADAMPQIKLTLGEYERILGDMMWFGGASLSLADLHLAPIFAYMSATPEGGELMRACEAWRVVGEDVGSPEHGQDGAAIRVAVRS